MDNYWSNQVILVTGSSRGIGRDLAIHFANLGAKVAINYNSNEQKAKEIIEQASQKDRMRAYKADVSKEEDVVQMIEQISKDLGAVTILVNNAGVTRDGLLMAMSYEDWRTVQSVHMDGMFFCSKAVMRGMVKGRFGRIINISSVSGIKGTAGQTNYSAAKAGMIGFTKALAREMGKRNITCNAIAPGVIETEMTGVLPPEVLKAYEEATALKRFGKASELNGLVEFLAGPNAGYITGQVVAIDGGMV